MDWRIEGPQHLLGHCSRAGREDRTRFFRAALSDERATALLQFTERIDNLWEARLVCGCWGTGGQPCSSTSFRLKSTPRDLEVVQGAHGWAGGYRFSLTCAACDLEFLLFDRDLHGWNAAVCGERDKLPKEYAANVDPYLQPIPCGCSANTHEILVNAIYDGEDIDSLPTEQQRLSFGSFAGWSICTQCRAGSCFLEAETA
jgi:hypothetical protein